MNWQHSDIASVISVLESGSRPKGGATVESGEIPSLGGENILKYGGVTLEEVKRVPRKFFENMTKGHLKNTDVLINKDGAQTGKVGFYKNNNGADACINEHLFLIRGDAKKITQSYLYYSLLSQACQNQIEAQISGSAQPGLKSDFLKGVFTRIPEALPEQSKIAEVLSKVDQAIEQTESLIAKQQRIKTGLMQDLLTFGIDENGNLRSEETHEFKVSPLGRIPKDWRDDKLGKTLLQIKRGPSLSTNNEMRGIIYLTSDNISDSGDLIWQIIKYLDIRSSNLNSILDIGDVILNCVNSEAQIGKVGFVDKLLGITTTGFNNFALSFDADLILPKFAFYFLSYSTFQRGLRKKIKPAINQSSFSASDLDDLPIVIPQIEEQISMIAKLDEISKAVHRLQKTHSKLNKIKTALMQDLLTGKVRVTPLMENMEVCS